MATFIDQDNIKKHYKSRLVGTVLNGYLSLRKLVVQRTKLIDETHDKLLELLEEMTTGQCLRLEENKKHSNHILIQRCGYTLAVDVVYIFVISWSEAS